MHLQLNWGKCSQSQKKTKHISQSKNKKGRLSVNYTLCNEMTLKLVLGISLWFQTSLISNLNITESPSHTRGANPTMVINPMDGCQLCVSLRWNVPALLKSITNRPPSCWALIHELNPALWQHLTSHLRPSKLTLYFIKLPLSCYYPIWWLT